VEQNENAALSFEPDSFEKGFKYILLWRRMAYGFPRQKNDAILTQHYQKLPASLPPLTVFCEAPGGF